jgi:flagellar motor switch/type III secretory pathway protein FliN
LVNVRPFDLGSCPAVPASEAAATRAALRVLSTLPPRWRVEAPPFEAVTLTVIGPDLETRRLDGPPGSGSPAAADPIVLALARGGDLGRLTLTSSFAARLVDAALGARGALSSARALGPAERGVLVALLAPAFDVIGWSLRLGSAPELTGVRALLTVQVEGPVGAGVLRLDLPASPVSTAGAVDHWRFRAADLPVVARIEIAATELPAASLIGLAPGDALVFDGREAVGYLQQADQSLDETFWEGRLVIGEHAAAVHIAPAGLLELAGDFHMTGSPIERTVAIVREGPMDVSGPTEKAISVLAAAPIEVVAELARVTLRGDEVLGLAPGVVLTVLVDRRRAIALRVGGEIWAEGELVDVDGELGVRVTRLLRTEG